MAQFRETVVSWCGLLSFLTTPYFWVVALSGLSVYSKFNESSTSPSPSPSSAVTACSLVSLRSHLAITLRWMATLMFSTGFLIYYVRDVVDTVAAAETKGNAAEVEAYKLACEELKDAIKDVEIALAKAKSTPQSRDTYVNALGLRNVATMKAEDAKPKEGLARLQRGKRIWVRIVFVFALIFSFATGVCAAVAFYYSLQLQIGCINGTAEIFPFVVVGLISLSVHGRAVLIAVTHD